MDSPLKAKQFENPNSEQNLNDRTTVKSCNKFKEDFEKSSF